MKTLAVATATLALALSSGAALAQTTQPVTKSVKFSDLNLSTPEGQARLETRIESAIRDVCSDHLDRSGTRIRSNSYNECLANARASTQRQVAAALDNYQRGG